MRNKVITVFVVVWLLLFNYESTRAMLLSPWFKREMPKTKFLFPPAGWVMFYQIGESYGFAQVYGKAQGQTQWIDPHDILQTRAIGYDNIHRNALVSVLDASMERPFCDFLKKKFPEFESFLVTYTLYPSLTKRRFDKREAVAYECR